MIRSALVRFARTDAARLAVRGLERLLPADDNRLTVLTYHRIGDPAADSDLYPGLISATVDTFAAQMAYLARRYRPISVDDLMEVRHGAQPPPRSVLVTFDDAYRDFAELAVPILRQHGVPAILFVPTAYPDRPERAFWWDRLWSAMRRTTLPVVVATAAGEMQIASEAALRRAFREIADSVKAMPHADALDLLDRVHRQLADPGPCHAVLGWGALRALAAEGIAIAPHSRTHPRLDRIDRAARLDEIRGSWQDLEQELGTAVPPVFAYPDGGHDDGVVQSVRESGLQVAFTTRRGTNDARRIDWLRVRRINVGYNASLALIQAQLLIPSRLTGNARPRSAT